MSQYRPEGHLPSVQSAASNPPAGTSFPVIPAVSGMAAMLSMSQMRHEGPLSFVRSAAANPSAGPPFPGLSAVSGINPCAVRPDGGWGQQEMVSLWSENVGVPRLRRRVLPPTAASINGVPASFPSSEMPSTTMDSGISFTDLVTGGFTPADMSSSIPPPNQIPSSVEAPASVKATKKRTKNFTIDEDEMLISAWLNVSMDPVQGTNQSHSTYWNRIYEYFHTNKTFNSDRSKSSLMNRWTGIQHDVNLFGGCMSKIEGRNQSGASISDKQADALKMFTNEDGQHRSFHYMHCWKILKDQPKWKERCNQLETQKTANKKQKTMANSSPSTSTPLLPPADDERQPASCALERPPGNKKEKAKLRQRSNFEALDYLLAKKREADTEKEMKKELKKEERCNKAFALEEERISLEKKKFEFERDQHEEKIMSVDLSTMSANQQAYYISRQEEILARRVNN